MLHLYSHSSNLAIFGTFRCSSRPSSSLSATQKKRPSRGGQNLSDRYNRLAKSTQEKYVLSHAISDLSLPQPHLISDSRIPAAKDDVHTFRGFVIPKKPKLPGSDECCMSGCAVCVYDLYDESLNTYKGSVVSLRTSLGALGIPESEWPRSVQPCSVQQSTKHTRNAKQASSDAFEAMEQALKAKRDEEQSKDIFLPADDRWKTVLPSVKSLYEGLQWIIFSNR